MTEGTLSAGPRGGILRNPGSASSSVVDRLAHGALALCAGVLVLAFLAVLITLAAETVGFFSQVSVWEFLTESRWTPLIREKHFGILPLLSGSLVVGAGAGLVALPLGALSAVFLSEVASARMGSVARSLFQVLAGIPTVVFAYFALTFVTPALRAVLPGTDPYNAASAALVVGLMILPTVVSLSEEALRAVPADLREAAYALGATRAEVTVGVVVPAALPGILASFLFALTRAIGEAMVVTLAAGSSPHLTLNPLDSVQTMTAYLVQVGSGSTSAGTIEHGSLFAVGAALFLLTAPMGLAAHWIRQRWGRVGS